jgi:hypothetical protein
MPRGRPKYRPTEADRNTVRSMAATGFTHEAIAKCLGTKGVDEKTLRKHFRTELDTAAERANAAVANRAYQMAVTGDPPAATFFWLKCRARWQETHKLEHQMLDDAGKPTRPGIVIILDQPTPPREFAGPVIEHGPGSADRKKPREQVTRSLKN